ncbi:glycosyltransferase [Frigoriflavimonas asaccharolytica]|uniref:Rhamnosyltransferase n=1 Tax=Frigoriflavimonas asaccharolytica TaxID=2735899 RepID=A0A8J8G4Z9_9FLAO|nr:glycosyltransferase [Frigoriflavimonas asaccharolytica]NRS91406.1 rhamnosyltransferase [Frigoriflavimonas asaccharolytica]
MFVEILMCTYNGEDFLEQQIQSILAQTYKNFKLIIVDDISQDRTVEIIKKMMKTDARIEFHQNEKNLGYFNNFLSGLDFVTSEYLFFADQDDVWLKNKIEIQLKDLMQEKENVFMNFTNSFLLYGELNINSKHATKRNPDNIKKYYNSPIELALKNIVAGHTILIKTHQIPRIKDRMSKIVDKKNLYFDYVLTLLLLDKGRIKYLDQSLVYFRQHPKSTSTIMRMNYYKYVSSNAFAFSQISESSKNVQYFSALDNTFLKKSNFPTYSKLLYQNLLNFKLISNNYDFFTNKVKFSNFKKIRRTFRLSYRFSKQK